MLEKLVSGRSECFFFRGGTQMVGKSCPSLSCCTGVLIILSCTASQKSTKEGLPFVETLSTPSPFASRVDAWKIRWWRWVLRHPYSLKRELHDYSVLSTAGFPLVFVGMPGMTAPSMRSRDRPRTGRGALLDGRPFCCTRSSSSTSQLSDGSM